MRCPKCRNIGGTEWDGKVCWMCGYVPVTDDTLPSHNGDVTKKGNVVVTPKSSGGATSKVEIDWNPESHDCPDCGASHFVRKHKTNAERQAAWRESRGN